MTNNPCEKEEKALKEALLEVRKMEETNPIDFAWIVDKLFEDFGELDKSEPNYDDDPLIKAKKKYKAAYDALEECKKKHQNTSES